MSLRQTPTRSSSPDRVPERPSEIKARLAADRLEAILYKQNLATYAATLGRHAAALGVSGLAPTWRDVRDPAVVQALKDRARVSARSIVQTQQARRAALVAQTGSKSAARAPFKDWADGQGDRIAQYEAGMTAAVAGKDFIANNADRLDGEEWIEPQDAAGDDECSDAISQGRQPFGTFDAPYHVNCPHYIERDYTLTGSADELWLGQN